MKAEALSIVLFTLAKERSLDPATIQRVQLFMCNTLSFALRKKNRGDNSVRWMDHQIKRKPRSPSICATNRLSRPVSAFSVPTQ